MSDLRTQPEEVTKTYRRPLSRMWWTKKKSYSLFMGRELTSVFIACYAVILLIQIRAVAAGPEPFNALASLFRSGGMVFLHVVIVLAALLHTVSWFRISGDIFGGERLSPKAVVAVNYLLWVVVSAVIAILIVRAGG
jgi:fumarate reductase subunit C